MKKLSLKEVKRRIRNHEALPDDVVKWYPKLMSRYSIRKAKRNPDGFTGKESRPRLKRYGKGEYRRSARSKELYPRAFVKNPKGRWLRFRDGGKEYETLYNEHTNSYPIKIRDSETLEPIMFSDVRPSIYEAAVRALQRHYAELHSDNPSRISRIKSHVKAHLDKDQRDFQKEIDEDDELKKWLEKNPGEVILGGPAQLRTLPVGAQFMLNKDSNDVHVVVKHYPKRDRVVIKAKGHTRFAAPGYWAVYPIQAISENPYSSRSRFKHEKWLEKNPKGKKRNPKRYRRMRNGDLVLAR